MLIRHCAYWFSLRGLGASTNATNVTVKIPRVNLFNPTSLTAIMTRIGVGGLP